MSGSDKYGAWHLTRKGYLRYHSGKYRNQYVHRVWAAKYCRRKLRRDEEVHHRNSNKLDYSRNNLMVLGTREHGWVSALQHWYMRQKEAFDQQEFERLILSESQDTEFNFGQLAKEYTA